METAITACDWDSASFLIFSPNVVPLVYYSHLLPLIISLLLGGFILYNNRRTLANWALAFIMLMFSLWVYFDLILWASPSPADVMFFWSSIVPIEMLIYASCLYLVYLFSNGQRDISLGRKFAIAAFFIPIVLFTHTSYNVLGLSPDCDEGAIEGPLIQYMYVVEIIYIIWAALVLLRGLYTVKKKNDRLQLLLIGLGTIVFLVTFTLGNITLVFSFPPDWEQYKLFGMPLFAAFIAYCVVRFRSFDSKALTSEVLVTALAIATISLLFLEKLSNVRVVAALTFVLVCVLGYLLIRNVRREIEQRERIEKLAKDLEAANARLKELDTLKSEFLSIASHQLRAPITAVRGYVANVLDGSYGPVPKHLIDPLHVIRESSRLMANSIEDYLNISRIEQGRMKYEKTDFDLAKLAGQVAEELRPQAEDHKLTLSFEGAEGVMVHADVGKVKQVFTNLVDNAIKYTEKGGITVSVAQEGGKAVFRSKDTGIGIAAEDIGKLFSKFTRARGANDVNTTGTGLGLYVAKQLAEGNGGTIRIESEGKGKGSVFIVELPLK